ncbi:uncharacterized protein LOC100376558 [Saccoglossus kowalevskii]|uniref:Uncharacterized protein LOC100376558 n=1 Tax=Saccoglossus kowalevskii TaxID=10224 RepID=A0ABM0GKD7_SACKO|nr:PREDICTED: uncharacterized protein LOC100376558 [Saccoglossus kowalevskii]
MHFHQSDEASRHRRDSFIHAYLIVFVRVMASFSRLSLVLLFGVALMAVLKHLRHDVGVVPGDDRKMRVFGEYDNSSNIASDSKGFWPQPTSDVEVKPYIIAADRVMVDEIFLRHPWLQKRSFMPNYYTTSGVDESVYKRRNTSVAFVHLPKAAGITMKMCLDKLANRASERKPLRMKAGTKEYPYEDMPKQKYYVSEFTFGVCDSLNAPCSYFTVLREPYERLISCYQYCRTQDLKDPICMAGNARTSSVNEWAVHQGSYFFRQLLYNFKDACFQTDLYDTIKTYFDKAHYRGPNYYWPPCWYMNKKLLDRKLDKDDKEALLQYVLDNLENWFGVIGIVEDYPITLRLLERAYGQPFYSVCGELEKHKSHYASVSESTEKQKYIDTTKAELAADKEVFDALYYDLKIYEKAVEIFDKQQSAFLRAEIE